MYVDQSDATKLDLTAQNGRQTRMRLAVDCCVESFGLEREKACDFCQINVKRVLRVF